MVSKTTKFKKAAVFAAMLVMAIIFSFSAVPMTASAAEFTPAETAAVSLDNVQVNAVTVMPLANDANNNDNGNNENEDDTTGDEAYKSVIGFFVKWFKRIGMIVAFVGAIMFGLAIKNNDAEQKQSGLLTMIAGFVVAAICFASDMFNLFD